MARRRQAEPVSVSVVAATESSIAAASHLSPMDAGAVATLRSLASKVDADDAARAVFAEEGGKPPPVDNVSVPTYLRFCESLGLTPAGRARMESTKAEGDDGGGTLGKLRAIHGGK